MREEIISRIKLGLFDEKAYVAYFPESKVAVSLKDKAPTFASLAQAWVNTHDSSPATMREYVRDLNNRWIPVFGCCHIQEISVSDLREAIADIDWPSNKTRNNALIALRGVFDLAFYDGLIQNNPTERIKNLKHQDPEPDPFSREEAETILGYLKKQYEGDDAVYYEYAVIAFFTGMRPSEMLALTWRDVDLYSGYVRVTKALSKGILNSTTKNSRIRHVLLNQRAKEALVSLQARAQGSTGAIFCSPRTGEPWLTEKPPRVVFSDALKAVGIRHRPTYNTRHTYATMLLMAGAKLGFVAKQLGHSPLMTLKRYSRWIDSESDWQEIEKLDTSRETKSS